MAVMSPDTVTQLDVPPVVLHARGGIVLSGLHFLSIYIALWRSSISRLYIHRLLLCMLRPACFLSIYITVHTVVTVDLNHPSMTPAEVTRNRYQ